MFKKIYIEITNSCNLNCDFCIKNDRENKFLSEEEFIQILDKIKPYTSYLYFHILGEPLMHPKINEFIDMAHEKGFNVNITTNGYLVDRIKTNNIRQLNVSLHSFNERYGTDLKAYLDNIFNKVDTLENTYISLRLWVKNQNSDEIINYINNRYNMNIKDSDLDNTVTIKKNNVFINAFHEFIWPDLNNSYYNEEGTCYALKDHIGILSNGTIIPCCLDTKGIINLGNIYNDDINDIMNSNRVKNMIKGFECNKKCEELCKHCYFLE